MTPPQESGPGSYSLLLFLFGLFLLVSPFATWWMGARPPWYFPFALWLMLIVLTAVLARRLVRGNDP